MKRKEKLPDILENELFDDEEVVWWGQPIPARLALQVDFMHIIVSAGVAAFAVFFYTMAQDMMFESSLNSFDSSRGDGIRSFVSLMFTIVPLLMFLGAGWQVIEPLRKYVMGTQTYYLLTNQRAVIIKNLGSRQVRSFYDENMDRIETQHFGNGIGSIIFATEQQTREIHNRNRGGFSVTFNDGGVNFGSRRSTRTVTIKHGFIAIHDARTVEDMMSQLFFSNDKKQK